MKRKLILTSISLSLAITCTACGRNDSAAQVYEDSGNTHLVEEIGTYEWQGIHSQAVFVEDCLLFASTPSEVKKVDAAGAEASFYRTEENYIEGICAGPDDTVIICERTPMQEEAVFCYQQLDLEGTVLNSAEFMPETDFAVSDMEMDKQGNLYLLMGESLYLLDKESGQLDTLELDTYLCSMCTNAAGEVLFGKAVDDQLYLSRFEAGTLEMRELSCMEFYGWGDYVKLFSGTEKFIYVTDENFLYQYDVDKKASTPVANWVELGINGGALKAAGIMESSNEPVVVTTQQEAGTITLKTLATGDMNAEKTQLVLACFGISSELMERTVAFNKQSEDYYIYIKDYAGETDPYTALNLDIISGERFDIIDLTSLPVENYIEKGLLADLSGYVDEDEYLEAYIQAVSVDGKIYQMSPNFYIYTIWGNEDGVGESSGWNFEEYREYLESNVDNPTLFCGNSDSLLRLTCYAVIKDYIGQEAGKMYFEEETFAQMLQFVKEFQGLEAGQQLINQGGGWGEMMRDYPTLLIETIITTPMSYQNRNYDCDGKQVAIGYPSKDRHGNYMGLHLALGICESSENKDAAWEFISGFLTDEAEYEVSSYGFPTRKDTLERVMKEHKEDTVVNYNGVDERIPGLSKKDKKALYGIFESAGQLMSNDTDIFNIVREEAQLYFADQQSLEKTVEYVANRVNLYLQEKQ